MISRLEKLFSCFLILFPRGGSGLGWGGGQSSFHFPCDLSCLVKLCNGGIKAKKYWFDFFLGGFFGLSL